MDAIRWRKAGNMSLLAEATRSFQKSGFLSTTMLFTTRHLVPFWLGVTLACDDICKACNSNHPIYAHNMSERAIQVKFQYFGLAYLVNVIHVYQPMVSSGRTSQWRPNCIDPHRQHIGLRLAQPFCEVI